MRSLVWFRSDLRAADNTALLHACGTSDRGVVGLFIISPAEWRAHDVAPCRVDLMLRTLRELSESLARLNIPLLIAAAPRAADVPPLVLNAAAQSHCESVCFNKEYEVDETRRDGRVIALFENDKRRAHAFTDQSVVEPGNVRTGEGKYFTVFTPFKRAWIKHITARGGISASGRPRKQPDTGIQSSPIPDAVPGFESLIPADTWPAGEKHASRRLANFIATRAEDYKSQRDFPGEPGTSQLSPYLAIGAISPRQCFAAAIEANAKSTSPLDSGSEGLTCWISELIWREFYIHTTAGFPRVCMNRPFQPHTERITWSTNADHLEAWKQGRTGVPIVDAGMRQLLATGWMHNRVRMIAAMYLTKNLLIDWREGERHFMRHLVDGFFASNNGGWQWSASTGTDAAPYFRVFNPVSQSQRFDESGRYIRRYVPELSDLDGDEIHEPWLIPPLRRGRLGYPEPLVDLSRSRREAISAFAAIRT